MNGRLAMTDDSSTVVVRLLTPADWELLRDLRLQALADAPEAFASNLEREQAFGEQDWRRRLSPGSANVVAWVGDVPVGIAGCFLHDGVHELVSMWVHPSARGGGAAALLIDAIRSWVADRGGDRLVLWVVEGNDRAERAYRRVGFEPTGVEQPVPGRPSDIEREFALDLPRGGPA